MRTAVSPLSKSIRRRHRTDQRGVSVVEVLIALSIGGVIVASVGGLLTSTKRISATISLRQQAAALAEDTLEKAVVAAQPAFTCTLPSGGSVSCTRDGQSCTPAAGYLSCWTEFPDDPASTVSYLSNGPLRVVSSGGAWQFANGNETLGLFTRSLTVTNLTDPSGGTNVKELEVKIDWIDRGITKSLTSTTIVTAWKSS